MDQHILPPTPAVKAEVLRFGITADCHLLGRTTPEHEAYLKGFVEVMVEWRPDFVMDVGDFVCQVGSGDTTREMHNGQLKGLVHHWSVLGPRREARASQPK